MFSILLGVFLILHGLVHLLYFGQSARLFELTPGMIWPDGSWTFSKFLGNEVGRNLVSILLILPAVGFILGGASLLLEQAWWKPIVVSTAVFSSAIFLLSWDGVLEGLDNKGGIGILINLAFLVALLIYR